MNIRSPASALGFRSGFTLIELLTVIAIVGILSSLLFVTFGGVTNNAKRAKTRVQFSQWATAIEAFRQEYGFYPDFKQITGNVIDSDSGTKEFVETLSGRTIDGDSLVSADFGWLAGNTKGIRFCSFGQDDLNSADRLVDAFGNDAIAVLFDRNYDGMIRIGGDTADYVVAEVPTLGGESPLEEGDVIRAGVIFYSAGAGNSESDVVTSW